MLKIAGRFDLGPFLGVCAPSTAVPADPVARATSLQTSRDPSTFIVLPPYEMHAAEQARSTRPHCSSTCPFSLLPAPPPPAPVGPEQNQNNMLDPETTTLRRAAAVLLPGAADGFISPAAGILSAAPSAAGHRSSTSAAKRTTRVPSMMSSYADRLKEVSATAPLPTSPISG